MIQLLILADDFTGALDTGVQLAKAGAVTHVVTKADVRPRQFPPETKVLVVDAETRHLPAEQARETIRKISAEAAAAGIPYLYKKTDSTLRGNIGAELQGALEGSGAETLFFIPAFPKLGRTTRDGTHYFNGVPIRDSVFGNDPFEPVRDSFIPDIIKRQSNLPVSLVRNMNECRKKRYGKTIVIFDADSDQALAAIAEDFYQSRPTNVLAGSAGFAAFLPDILDLKSSARPVHVDTPGILVVSGSLNPITYRQLEYAKKAGFGCVTLTSDQKLSGIPCGEAGEAFLNEIMVRYQNSLRLLVVSTCNKNAQLLSAVSFREDRDAVSENMGDMVRRLLEKGLRGTIVATGGDTLRGVLSSLGCTDIVPLCEIETGVVLSSANTQAGQLSIVSKSGGIGTDEVFVRIDDFLRQESRPNVRAGSNPENEVHAKGMALLR